jgi:hypothetical protein
MATTCPNFSVRLGHTNLTALNTTFADNVNTGQGSLTTVIDDQSFTVPAGNAGTWINVPLQAAFDYNGIDNLVVEFEKSSACTQNVFVDTQGGTNIIRVATATPSATSGDLDGYRNVVQFVFAGGDNAVRYPNVGSNSIPLRSVVDYQHAQMLHLASDINGSGPITGIAMISAATTFTATYTVNVKLGHTSLAALTDTFADNFNRGTPVSMATAATFTVPAGVSPGTPIWFPLDGVFTYNGTDNLIVDIEVTTANSTTTWWTTDRIAGRRLYAAVGSATGRVDDAVYHTVFRFNGGTMDIIGGNSASAAVFASSVSGFQFLLRAAELGTSGSIDKLACRLSVSSIDASYPNFTVTLAHTAQTVLVAADATNVAGGTTVYNATFNMPADLLVGDWVEIPFSTPFSYNGVDNLVVQTTTGAGPLEQYCRITGTDATRFFRRYKLTGGGTPLDYRGTFRFWVNK